MLQLLRLHSAEWQDDYRTTNWKQCRRKWPWLNLRCDEQLQTNSTSNTGNKWYQVNLLVMFTYIFRLMRHRQVLQLRDLINDRNNMRQPATMVFSILFTSYSKGSRFDPLLGGKIF
jgi:hypothetical protein